MDSKIIISVIILNFKGGKITQNCIDSVLQCSFRKKELVLIDNGSSEKEKNDLIKKYKGKLKIIISPENLGYAAGNNLGVEQASGEYIIFLNNDTIVDKNFIDHPLKLMKRDKKIAFLQPKIKCLNNKKYFEYAGGAGGFLDRFGFPFVRGRIFGTIEEDIGQYEDEREIFWASGVALFCRKEIFKRLGGFDPLFFAYAEENDLCFRAHRSNLKVVYCPKSTVYHIGGYTSNRSAKQKIFLIHRNHLILVLKNLDYKELLKILPIRILLDISSMFYYVYRYKSFIASSSVLRAYSSLFLNIFLIINSRKMTKGKYGYPKKTGLVYPGSVAWQYFFRKKDSWSEIILNNDFKSKKLKIF